MSKCPLCGAVVVYEGLSAIECAGLHCQNASAGDIRVAILRGRSAKLPPSHQGYNFPVYTWTEARAATGAGWSMEVRNPMNGKWEEHNTSVTLPHMRLSSAVWRAVAGQILIPEGIVK